MEDEYESWNSVINRSFFYNDFFAYTIKENDKGVTLSGFKKYNSKAYPLGELFFKFEWILPIISTFRSIPKNELDRGTDDSGYGDWSRGLTLLDDNGEEITVYLGNTWYEKSSPKLKISTYKEHNYNSITIPHSNYVEGYIDDVEPIFCELSKYIPEKDKNELLPPLGIKKTVYEKEFENYQKRIKKAPTWKKIPDLAWDVKQISEDSYHFKVYYFFDGKLREEQEFEFCALELAMARDYLNYWSKDINKLPYVKDTPQIKLELSANEEFPDYINVKLLSYNTGNSFELPASKKKLSHYFYNLFEHGELRNFHTKYLRGLHSFYDEDRLIVKNYNWDSKERSENSYNEFIVEKPDVQALVEGLEQYWKGIILCKIDSRKRHIFSYFEYFYYEEENGITSFTITGSHPHSVISFECYSCDYMSQFKELQKVLNEAAKKLPKKTDNNTYERIFWKKYHDYELKRHYITWQFEKDLLNNKKPVEIEIPKENAFRIYECAFWWWHATDHSKKEIYKGKNVYFEINPYSDKENAGTVELQFKKYPQKNIKTYFSLKDGTNFPKHLWDSDGNIMNSFIRKFKVDFSKKNSVCFYWWDSKYQELNDKTKHYSRIPKKDYENLKKSLKEIYDFLKNKRNEILKLLDHDFLEQYKFDKFAFNAFELNLELNGTNDHSVDENIPIVFTINIFDSEYISIDGTRKYILLQLELILKSMEVL